MSLPRSWYIQMAVAATALTTLSIHHLNLRKANDAERSRVEGQASILSELLGKYRSGAHVGDAEVQRLLRLADLARSEERKRDETTWREAVFGRKPGELEEEQEMERFRQEWNKALAETTPPTAASNS